MKNILKNFGHDLILIPFLDQTRGVYGLFHELKIMYVGSTTCLPERLGTHIKDRIKRFDRYCFQYVPPHIKLENVEAELIIKYEPLYNTSLPPNDIYICETAISKRFFKKKSCQDFLRKYRPKVYGHFGSRWFLAEEIELLYKISTEPDNLPF